MTIGELIDELRKMPQWAPVLAYDADGFTCPVDMAAWEGNHARLSVPLFQWGEQGEMF